MNILRIAFRNVLRVKLRLILTVLSVCIGILSVFLISSLGKSGEKAILTSLEQIGAHGIMITIPDSIDKTSFSSNDAFAVAAKERHINGAMPFLTRYASCSFNNSDNTVVVWGIGENGADFLDMTLVFGRLPNKSEINNQEHVCVISAVMAEQAYGRQNVLGKNISVAANGFARQYRVIGIIAAESQLLTSTIDGIPAFVYAPYTTVAADFQCTTNRLIVNYDRKAISPDTAKRSIIKSLRSSMGGGISYEINDLESEKGYVGTTTQILTSLLSATAAISLIVAGIGIMNTMLTSVAERRGEIGISKAIGAGSAQIAGVFLLEASIMTALGIIAGITAGIVISVPVFAMLQLEPAYDWNLIAIAAYITLASGIVFGVFPAIRAARLDPIIALKDEN